MHISPWRCFLVTIIALATFVSPLGKHLGSGSAVARASRAWVQPALQSTRTPTTMAGPLSISTPPSSPSANALVRGSIAAMAPLTGVKARGIIANGLKPNTVIVHFNAQCGRHAAYLRLRVPEHKGNVAGQIIAISGRIWERTRTGNVPFTGWSELKGDGEILAAAVLVEEVCAIFPGLPGVHPKHWKDLGTVTADNVKAEHLRAHETQQGTPYRFDLYVAPDTRYWVRRTSTKSDGIDVQTIDDHFSDYGTAFKIDAPIKAASEHAQSFPERVVGAHGLTISALHVSHRAETHR